MDQIHDETCGFCKYFKHVPGSDPDGFVTWGHCMADFEREEETFHVDLKYVKKFRAKMLEKI